ncbi:Uncharacterised protein [Serratia proteamaculans]|uniref:biofilm development regulator YmgB/AriR family protein n=1 Tax=Serratia proteamaculans TaxID=28151 RepID=UPI0021784CCB|nr:biofilm development regulator YmgB/AriR family protein [Serratia proteamaculans]CAI0776539.1 Uncharacterised protein [Serratia proteamaculans]
MKREIDLKFYGLIGNEEEIHLEIYEILGKCLTHIASAKKTVSRAGILAHLVNEIEAQSCDYTRKLYRVAIEMVGVRKSE